MTDETGPPVFSVEEVAKKLGKSRRWIVSLLRDREIGRQAGRTILLTKVDYSNLMAVIADIDKHGFIYIVGYSEFLKIGFTTNVRKRLSAIQSSLPIVLTTYCIFAGSLEQEQNLHIKFAEFKLRGEWFRQSPDLMTYIAELQQK